jgi:hypothetical protein
MPIRKVSGGYKWGSSGKVYPTRAGAVRQAQAAYASGYKADKKKAGGFISTGNDAADLALSGPLGILMTALVVAALQK